VLKRDLVPQTFTTAALRLNDDEQDRAPVDRAEMLSLRPIHPPINGRISCPQTKGTTAAARFHRWCAKPSRIGDAREHEGLHIGGRRFPMIA